MAKRICGERPSRRNILVRFQGMAPGEFPHYETVGDNEVLQGGVGIWRWGGREFEGSGIGHERTL